MFSQSGSCSYPRGESPISAMTEKIIDYRRQALDFDHSQRQAKLGPNHWSNIPPGQKLFEEFQKVFPKLVNPELAKLQNDPSYYCLNKFQRPYHFGVGSDAPWYAGTAFDAEYRNYKAQTASEVSYVRPTKSLQEAVDECRARVALRHVDAAGAILRSC